MAPGRTVLVRTTVWYPSFSFSARPIAANAVAAYFIENAPFLSLGVGTITNVISDCVTASR